MSHESSLANGSFVGEGLQGLTLRCEIFLLSFHVNCDHFVQIFPLLSPVSPRARSAMLVLRSFDASQARPLPPSACQRDANTRCARKSERACGSKLWRPTSPSQFHLANPSPGLGCPSETNTIQSRVCSPHPSTLSSPKRLTWLCQT
jgi:hypothetical protein